MAWRISFSTPDGEVKVEEPVKCMAHQDEIVAVAMIRATVFSHPRVSAKIREAASPIARPVIAPFLAKARPGTQGSSRGVITAPVRRAIIPAATAGPPRDHAAEREKISGPMPPTRNRATIL